MDYNRTKEQLLTDANAIKGESTIGANTADRIGGILHDIVEHLDPNLPDYTTYNLLPTPSIMQFGVDPTTNEFTPTQIPLTCRIEKRVGNGDGDDTVTTYDNGIVDGTDLKLYYKKYFSNGTESIYTLYSGSITVAAEAVEVGERVTSVNFYLAQQADGSSISGLVRQVNVPVVRTGKSSPGERGEPALRLNMSNDMDAIPCNSDKVVPVQTDIKTVVSVYLGSEIQKGEGIVSIEDTDVGTIEVMREGVSYSVLGIVSELGPKSPSGLFEITWTFDAGDILTSKKYQVPITVNYNGTPYHATFIVVAVEGLGTMQLLPNPTQITFANGEEDVKKYLKLDIQKKEGSDIQYLSVSDSGLNVRYSFNSMPNDDEDGDSWIDDVNPSNGLEVSYANTSVYIAAFNSEGLLVDRETVPVLTDGADGNLGRFYYFAGDWGNIEHPENLTVNENQAPYVRHSDREEVKYYMCISPNNTGIADDTPDNNPSCWTEMEQLDYAISKAVFSDYAKLGSAIISGDWMISQHGTINGVSSTNYIAFNPEHPNDNIGTNFIPNYAVNLLTGATYQHDVYITGGTFADKVSKIVCKTWMPGSGGTGPSEQPKDYYLYTATEGEHLYACDHVGSITEHRDYYSVGKIELKSNHFFILASGINDSGTIYSVQKAPLRIKLPNPKYCIGQSIIITNKSTGFPPNSLLLEQEYVRYNGSNPREDGQAGSSSHFVCMTAKELLYDYPMYPKWDEEDYETIGNPYKWDTVPPSKEGRLPNDWTFKDGEPVLGSGSNWTVQEDEDYTKEYTAPQGNSSMNGIWLVGNNNFPTILTELDLNNYEWIELVAVGWNIILKSSINPSIINTYFSDFYCQWMVTRWKEKPSS